MMTNNKTTIELIWIVFIALQPVIDVIALSSNSLPSLIRGGFLLIAFIYLFKNNQARIYLILISCYVLIHLVLIVFIKQPLALNLELSYIIKTIYFPIILLFVKKNFKSLSYEMLAKQGHTGWFFSGNELSVIMLIGLAIILAKLLIVSTKRQQRWLVLILVIHITNMLIIGTKVSLFSIFILLGVAVLLTLKKPANKKLGVMLGTLFLLVFFAIPYAPAGQNTTRIVSEPQHSEDLDQDNDQVIDQMLSGRSDFLAVNIDQYKRAPLSLKLFGLGYGGLYEEEPKLVEMDMFDWLFGFGILGLVILIYPIIVLVLEVIPLINMRLNKSQSILLIAIFLSLGAAFTAGHVMSAPAVSIYLILILIKFYRQFTFKKSLLVISTMYPSKRTPAFGIFIKNQVEQLKKHGLNINVLAIKNHKMNLLSVLSKYTSWLIRFSFILIFKAERYQVIHAHYLFPSGWLGQLIKHIYGTRLIVTSHGGDIDKMPKKHPRIKQQIKKILDDSDEIIAVGETLKNMINKRYKIAHTKIILLNMGVNREVFKPGSKIEARTKLTLPADQIIILFVGNLIKAKGLRELVSACESLSTQHQLECHLVGANKEPAFLKQLLNSSTIKLHLHEATNQLQIAQWLRAADVLVLPSHMEGFGLAALESMSCHTPVIGTNVGGLAHLLSNHAGLKVPPHDAKTLAHAIDEMIKNQELRDKCIKNGEEKAKKFDQEKVIKKLLQLYDNKEP